MKKPIFYILLLFFWLVLAFIIIELAFRFIVFRSGSDLQQIYLAITNPEALVPYSSQPYLNYINTPGLKDKYGNCEINKMGIRYPREIELKKPDSTLRILFLGGSTTFGEIDEDYDAFPALVEKILKRELISAQSKYKDIECLNGGVHGHTTAEILNHFQYKYQYLQPDIVVLHVGVNDAFTYAQISGATYQPDYHNSRRVFYDIKRPRGIEKLFTYSKTYTYFLVNTRLQDFMNNTLEKNIFYLYTNDKLWFNPGNTAIGDTSYNAFYNNVKTIISIANNRNAKVLIVPEVIDTTKIPGDLGNRLLGGLQLNKNMLLRIASREKGVVLKLLPESEFSPLYFEQTDGIHTNEKGECLKADNISSFLIDMVK